MARLSNLYGAAPVAAPQHRAGGGGGNNRPNRPRNRPGGGGGAGVAPAPTSPANGPLGGGLYTGDQGAALANTDPDTFFLDLLAQAGQYDYSGTAYGEYVNKTRAQELRRQYDVAQQSNQSLNPVDFAQQQYGAGWTETTTPGDPRRHGHGRRPGDTTTTFNAGNLPSDTAQSYNQWFSNTSPDIYLSNQHLAGGATLPTGGNAEFDRYLTDTFDPKLAAAWQAAQAAGIAAGGGALPSAGTPAGNAQTTLPIGAGGDFGGDPMSRRQYLRDQGMRRLNHMNPNARHAAKGQYQDYLTGFDAPATPGTAGGTSGATPPVTPLSLADFIQGRDLTNEARNAFAFRPNAMRLPGPINLSGRYSWWS